MTRVKASYRLGVKTVEKLKKLSAVRKRSQLDPSMGKIIDELVADASTNGRSVQLSVAAAKKLRQMERQHGLAKEKLLDFLIKNSKLELQISHTIEV